MDNVNVRKVVSIDVDNLTGEMQDLPASTQTWASHAAEAAHAAAKAKATYEQVYARACEDIRNGAAARGEKLTETRVENRARLTMEVVVAVSEMGTANYNLARIKAVVEALAAKRDMLIQLGSTQREEIKQEIRVNGNRSTTRK